MSLNIKYLLTYFDNESSYPKTFDNFFFVPKFSLVRNLRGVVVRQKKCLGTKKNDLQPKKKASCPKTIVLSRRVFFSTKSCLETKLFFRLARKQRKLFLKKKVSKGFIFDRNPVMNGLWKFFQWIFDDGIYEGRFFLSLSHKLFQINFVVFRIIIRNVYINKKKKNQRTNIKLILHVFNTTPLVK